jgi:hypothetical protein
MSIETMKSSRSKAFASRSPLGVESTGLPHRAHAFLARGIDLLGHAGRGELAIELGEAAHARSEARVGDRAAVIRHRLRLSGRGTREHQPARPVEVPGQDVDDVDEPARQCAELLGAGAESPVADGVFGGGEIARKGADVLGGDARGRGDDLRGEGLGEIAHRVDAVGEIREPPQGDATLGEEHVDECE